MGYTTRNNGYITDFWPDNTDTEIYIAQVGPYMSLWDIITRAKKKWPDANPDSIIIYSEKIHTSCIYHDLHDDSDWTDFIIIEFKG